MNTRHCIVLDIGKTNVKLHVLNEEQESLADFSRENLVLYDPPYPQVDVDGIWNWTMDIAAVVSTKFDVTAVVVTAHGATAALVDPGVGENALALPILDYEWSGLDPSDQYASVRPAYSETLSPDLPGGLNLGRQIYWQQADFPDQFRAVKAILLYPQYWAYRFSGEMVAEVSSLGCHTDLWSPEKAGFSGLVAGQNWQRLMPPIVPAWESIGSIRSSVAERAGLPTTCRVHAGAHDSGASFLRYVLAKPDQPFCVVSTGTWVICMSTDTSCEQLDESRDMLANVDVNNECVACARFMGGREYAAICSRLGAPIADQVRESDVERTVKDRAFALPDFSGGSGPFGGRKPEFLGPIANGSALATIYCALMVDYCLDLLGVENEVIIVGSYLRNPVLCSLIAQLRREQPVNLSSDQAGAVRGAAQLTDWQRPVSVSLTRCEPALVDGLAEYARQWRALAEGRT